MNKFTTIPAFFSIVLFFSCPLIAQKDSTSAIKYSWGMSLGFIKPKIKYTTTDWVKNGLSDTLKSVSNTNIIGLSAGIQLNMHINHKWVLRLGPELLLHNMNFIFIQQDGNQSNFYTEVGSFEIPFHLVYTLPCSNFSPSLFMGGRYCIDIPDNSKGPRKFIKTRLDTRPDGEGLDMGLGFNIKIASFMLRPEIMYFHSTSNVLKTENINMPFKTFSEIKRNYISVKINFCGLKW
jgi:hypothetical protein